MATLLICIIYVTFISLGLPDSLLGSAWPVMRLELGAAIDFAGVISMIIAGSTIISSLLSDRMNWRFGTGKVCAVSVGLTAVALMGFSLSGSLWQLCLWAIPYGLGAGAIDAALNDYVALHYSARHMSWLHCFWGVGASISPYVMGWFLTSGGNWRGGYRTISIVQFILTLGLFLSLSVWRINQGQAKDAKRTAPVPLKKAICIPGVWCVLLAFFGYCACETTAGLWASSYLVESRGVNPETAADFASLFYLGITFGRFLNGFIADRMGDRRMIRIGAAVILAGCAMIALPLKLCALAGLVVVGFGCAPVYPSIIHLTPANFGAENSQAIIGIQMASAYAGSTLMPPVFGLLARHVSMGLFPLYLGVFTLVLVVMTEKMNRLKDSLQK